MNEIHIFTDDVSNNHRILRGKSRSGKTYDSTVEKINVSNRDELISKALIKSPEDSYILCAYGNLLTTMSTTGIYDAIEFAIDNIDFDVLYLTTYADDCDFNSDEYSYENMEIKKSVSPHGTECILISPEGFKKIYTMVQVDGRGYDYTLNSLATSMNLYTTHPSMISVNLSKEKSDTKLIKGTLCRENINLQKPLELTKKYTGNMNLFWFFIIVIFILFIAAMLLSFDKSTSENTGVRRDPLPDGKQDIASSMTPYTSTVL